MGILPKHNLLGGEDDLFIISNSNYMCNSVLQNDKFFVSYCIIWNIFYFYNICYFFVTCLDNLTTIEFNSFSNSL